MKVLLSITQASHLLDTFQNVYLNIKYDFIILMLKYENVNEYISTLKEHFISKYLHKAVNLHTTKIWKNKQNMAEKIVNSTH